ncbi:hypothetical protein BP6252_04834 [Coleophoma cylindrospora]|uniref:Xylanolytic transcriptional activator regulatory domain-containing protein n=1 Tax=Coleophoma cylindrospora TaxID=1849047 RepID=A0A3D8S1R7_9HELO|nr:hypothetical protein BP6252_04834 [Coleophoma cylindrospora]
MDSTHTSQTQRQASLSVSDIGSSNGSTTKGNPIKLKRAPVACKRCRRLRGKCVHESANPPCDACRLAGPDEAAECFFPARGEKGPDRDFRRKRTRRADIVRAGDASSSASPGLVRDSQMSQAPNPTPLPTAAGWNLLPPHPEVLEGCKIFTTSFFQLGFIPKALFLERLSEDRESVNVFLILSILSLSGRFTPSLVRRYGSQAKATEFFLSQAAHLVPYEMYQPSLERTQAFFLLGIAEWGNGDRNRSCIHMAIAIKMAGILCLHKEETYKLSETATSDDVVNSEIARRTFWMLESQDNLHSGHNTPASFSLADITTLLPCEESDFAFGLVPQERAALLGTRAAAANPALTKIPSRSLFASLIQTHNLWGQVARRACRNDSGTAGVDLEPWNSSSEYVRLTVALQQWGEQLPKRHQWSVWNLRGYKAEALDLAYLSVVMPLRLSNIVVRRVHLEEIMASMLGNPGDTNSSQAKFWQNMSYELFTNVLGLYEQIDAFFSHRSSDEGFPAMIVFCVYICGSLASYLWKWPQICPYYAHEAEPVLLRTLEILETLQYAWPTAMRWAQSLRTVATPSTTTGAPPLTTVASQEQFFSLADGAPSRTTSAITRIQPPNTSTNPNTPSPSNATGNLEMLSSLAARIDQRADEQHRQTQSNQPLSDLENTRRQQHLPDQHSRYRDNRDRDDEDIAFNHMPHLATMNGMSGMEIGNGSMGHFGLGMPIDDFEAELTAFLQGEVHLGILND